MTSLRLDLNQAFPEGMANVAGRRILNSVREELQNSRKSIFNSGGLAIKAGGSALAATANAVYGMVEGVVFTKAAADMAALSGTVTNAKFNVFVFTVDSGGNLATYMGTEGAALINVVFPTIPDDEAVIGFVIINPTGTGNFVGGTTALDDGTVVPNAVYVNTPFPFNIKTSSSLEA